MTTNINKRNIIIEGKTKIIFENPTDLNTYYMYFKDDITAGDGIKKDTIKGKALIDWQTNRNIFEYLNKHKINTHYLSSPEERISIVKRPTRKINLEVVTRRIATGSIIRWSDIIEGTRFDPLITQFHYKDDSLHDPMLNDQFIDHLINSKNAHEFERMRSQNINIFTLLESAFTLSYIQLIDLKLEYGIIDDEVVLIDEVTGGSFRLWPYANKNPNFNQENVIDELNPKGRLDKDIYRHGGELDEVKSKFEQIASITASFKDL